MILKSILLAAILLNATEAVAEVVVVVSAKSAVPRLNTAQVAKIFLAKTDTFPDGSRAEPLDQAEGLEVRNEFYAKVTGKDHSQLKAYWSKLIFTGDGQPPRIVENDEAVIQAVARDVNAIGYINKKAVDDSVKVVCSPDD